MRCLLSIQSRNTNAEKKPPIESLASNKMRKTHHTKTAVKPAANGNIDLPARKLRRLPTLSQDSLDKIFSDVGEELRNGRSAQAERILRDTIENHTHTNDVFANLKRLLSFTLETVGDYKSSLAALQPYEDVENLQQLGMETQVRVSTQLAIAYSNLSDQPKAVTLLKETLLTAKENSFDHLVGSIDVGLARVYRKLNEFPIARDYAQRALSEFRQTGNWIGIAEAYREIALSFHHEGNAEKAIENFEQGVKMIGGNSAPFMLGRLYTEMSGAYWFLRRPQDGVKCLEKSIKFFDQTEHALNSVIAYNNLGINLMLIGRWEKAEEVIDRALDLATKLNHPHVAGVLDSRGELQLLRGQYDEARETLEQAIAFAQEKKREWYTIQAMRNLARCFLAQGANDEAIALAKETIELSRQIGDKHFSNMAGLVLAEASLNAGDLDAYENALTVIEEGDASYDFFVLGNVQRIRGSAALKSDDRELAIHHFSRALTIFEAASDAYHTALLHYLVGSTVGETNSRRARRHLNTAAEIFHNLKIGSFVEIVTAEIQKLRIDPASLETTHAKVAARAGVSPFVLARVTEATASRELLFRELVSVLQEETRAKKILIAERNEQKRLIPFITHGYSPAESTDVLVKLDHELRDGQLPRFSRSKNTAVFPLKPNSPGAAFLLIHPREEAVLSDGSPFQSILSVIELAMDVIALRESSKTQTIEVDAETLATKSVMPGFIHSSPAMAAVVEEIYKIRSSDVTVLVTGESGTGKELVARAIQTLSNRKDKIFVPFNCTAVPKELAEGHLFGYRKGAFTGAIADSPGMIRAADGGTLFLDEVGDLPLDVQPKLLRFLQEGEVQPIGEKKPIKVDVRVIAATNMPLEEKVSEGTFREDLFYRLNVIRLRVPPLRERRSEIPPIISYYVDHYAGRFGKHGITFTPQTVDLLMVCNWEGNVRQLCNEVQRVVARAVDNEVITPDHLSPELKRSAKPLTPFGEVEGVAPIASYDGVYTSLNNGVASGRIEDAVADLETRMIKGSLARHNWNISRVASELGLTRRGLYLKLSRYSIEKNGN